MDSTVPIPAFAAPLKFALDRLKNRRCDDSRVVSFHIILRDFTIIPLLLFREEIHGIAFLQERVALVFLVFKHVADGPGVPLFFVTRCRDAISGELGCDAEGRHAL